MAEKTEPASQKKLRDARKKGQVAKAQDFPTAVTFLVSVAATMALAGKLYDGLGAFMITLLKEGPKIPAGTSLTGLVNHALELILNLSLPILFFTFFVGVMVHFLIVGPVFSAEAMKFQFKRLNPVENLKQKFKIKTWVELIKQMLKVSVAFYLMYGVIKNSLGLLVATAALPVMAQAAVVKDMLMSVVIRVGVFFLGVAIFDLVFQRRQFAKEMKMEKFEVKQEYRDTEGDPEIKWKRKQIAREVAYDEGPRAVRRARAVVTNPTHLAIALGYDPAVDPAPIMLTKGYGEAANQMMRIAEQYNIPIVRNIPLAHLLFYKGQVNRYVPAESFELVAQLFITLQRLEEEQQQQTEPVGAF
jgi:type III secretion protein U